ncbi:hypothetical protein AB0A69_32640 [Streptomyces sp. NPDC045431]|uniref:hypothetical protein n=1 Tax=Streptomyces sp. NPDC045431 TaxID=3155613 RepID=UPI0033F94C0F
MIDDLIDFEANRRKPLGRALSVAWYSLLLLIGVPVLLVVGVVVTYGVQSALGEDFPEVDPTVMAQRATDRSREMYDVAGIVRTVPAGSSGGDSAAPQNTLSAAACYPDGLESLNDEPEKGSYRLGHSWTLDRVPEQQGVPALHRLHDHLKNRGWTITQFRATGEDWELRAERHDEADDNPDRVVFTWWSHWQTLEGYTAMPCAYDVSGPGGPESADGLEPPTLGSRGVS